MDSIPDDLLELQTRFDQWRANRKYNREPIPEQLRDAALEMNRRYPPSLLRRVLKIQLFRLMPKTKTHARRSKPQQAQSAFFKLQPPAASLGAESFAHQTSTAYRLQLERPDGSRLTLTLPSFDASALHALCADFPRGPSKRSLIARVKSDQSQHTTAIALCETCHLQTHQGNYGPRKPR